MCCYSAELKGKQDIAIFYAKCANFNANFDNIMQVLPTFLQTLPTLLQAVPTLVQGSVSSKNVQGCFALYGLQGG